MVFVFLDNPKGFQHNTIRTSRGGTLKYFDPEDRVMQKFLRANGIDVFGKGVDGGGVNIFGGALVPIRSKEQQHYEDDGYLVVRGSGVGTFFKKTGNKILAWSKKNVMPLLTKVAKESLITAKRVGADVVENVAEDVAKAGADAIGKKLGNNLVGDIAKLGVSQVGKQVKGRAKKYVDEQEKTQAYSTVEDRLSEEIAGRSRAILQGLIAKNNPAPAKGKGMNRFINDQVKQ